MSGLPSSHPPPIRWVVGGRKIASSVALAGVRSATKVGKTVGQRRVPWNHADLKPQILVLLKDFPSVEEEGSIGPLNHGAVEGAFLLRLFECCLWIWREEGFTAFDFGGVYWAKSFAIGFPGWTNYTNSFFKKSTHQKYNSWPLLWWLIWIDLTSFCHVLSDNGSTKTLATCFLLRFRKQQLEMKNKQMLGLMPSGSFNV